NQNGVKREMTLKDRVKELCEKNGVSMNKLESDCGFGRGYISKLEKSTPNSQKLQKIADYFDISLDYLMTGDTSQPASRNLCLKSKIEEDAELRSALEKYFELPDAKKRHILELICFLSEK
ncbi:MAG: helix-turn-helix domain-containing protein, partial [Lachnospiraceae bacterium]|nr:helix-turn-helix domain-containing protein [Lachnospiraceae bacterium]